ncbi:MAG: hypothetical protein B1H12_08785 [Desulfobacteraceae bacterium 4484_190.2]|nr:MAG: hypothetical protein B1H12_08785 [Desulfobacteraceae bacterium 4484_190.2]
MQDIFRIIKANNKREENKKTISIGIDLQIAGREICGQVSEDCHSYEDLVVEVGGIKRNLESVLDEAKKHFKGPEPKGDSGFEPETSDEEIWTILSGIQNESIFVERFNIVQILYSRNNSGKNTTREKCFLWQREVVFVFEKHAGNPTSFLEVEKMSLLWR